MVNVQYKPELGQINCLIRKLFPRVRKQFRDALNCLYFTRDIPKTDTTNKLKNFLNNFAGTVSFLRASAKDQHLIDYLKYNYGIEITFSSEIENNGETPKELLKMSIDSGLSLIDSIIDDENDIAIKTQYHSHHQ